MTTYIGDRIYGWSDQNASPTTYYTDNTILTRGMTLYNNQGVDTGARVGYIHDGMFEIEDYVSIYNDTYNELGTNSIYQTFVPKKDGYYRLTAVGGGAIGYAHVAAPDSTYTGPSDYAASGGAGALIIVEVYLQSSVSYLLYAGRMGYVKRTQHSGYSTYSNEEPGSSGIYLTDDTSTYILASRATNYRYNSQDGTYTVSTGGAGIITNGSWNIRRTISNVTGGNGSFYYANGFTGVPALSGAPSSLTGTTYGIGASTSAFPAETGGATAWERTRGTGGYIEIQLIDS